MAYLMRVVVDTQWLVVSPTITAVSIPASLILCSRSVPMKAELTFLTITGSDDSGFTSSLTSWPGLDGWSGDPGKTEA